MAYLTSDGSYRLGHADIDRHHERLFDAINSLHDALLQGRGRPQVTHCIAFLRRYTIEHFGAEEFFMIATAYPEGTAHAAQHKAFVGEVDELEARLVSSEPLFPIAVLNFLRDWLASHILEHDRRLVAYLATVGPLRLGETSSAGAPRSSPSSIRRASGSASPSQDE